MRNAMIVSIALVSALLGATVLNGCLVRANPQPVYYQRPVVVAQPRAVYYQQQPQQVYVQQPQATTVYVR